MKPGKRRIHHSVKFSEFSPEWHEFFTEEGIFPEIYFQAEDLERITHQQLLLLEKELHQKNMGISIHAPFLDLSPGAFDEKIREVTAHRLNQALDVAEVLKPNIVNGHAHYEHHRFSGKIDLWLERAVRTFEPIVRRAERLKTILTVENTFEGEPAPIERLISKIGSPNFRVCFDTGHFHIFHKVPLKQWWEVLGKKVSLLHLHDNHGQNDEHLPIGLGNFPFLPFFNLLKEFDQEITYTLECHSLINARKTLRAVKKLLD